MRGAPRLLRGILSLIAGLVAVAATPAAAERVENFALLDHRGRFHELHDHRDARAVVLFVQGNGCPIARNAVPALDALRKAYAPRGVVFLGLNASPQDDRAAVAEEVADYGIAFPVLVDETQLVAEALGVDRTAEVLLIDPDGWQVVYRGPVDDRLDYETQRPARRHFLREALDAHLAGGRVERRRRESPGCLIFFPHRDPEAWRRISYAEDVAPILVERCRDCHREGGVAPWAMTDFAMVRGWSPMIREVIRTRRMPPWDADPAVGRFRNASGLTPDEARTLVHWVEAGAPRGGGADPLATRPAGPPQAWPLGEPDLVLTGPVQEIPATGVVPYRYETLEVPIDREVWLRAADLRPTNLAATHHVTAYLVPPEGTLPDVEGPRFNRGLFAGYVPGRQPQPYPEDTGFRLPAGTRIRLQLHYDTTGRPEHDVPRVGLYLAETPPRHELAIGAAASFDFEIPAGARRHRERAVQRLERDIVVHRVTPHMHYRGRAMRIEVRLPDGTRETLLSVPRYRFDWQRQYVLDEPRRLPAGSAIVAEAVFDNSRHNPANPDPTRAVGFGEQSFDEMLFGYFLYHEAPSEEPSATARSAAP